MLKRDPLEPGGDRHRIDAPKSLAKRSIFSIFRNAAFQRFAAFPGLTAFLLDGAGRVAYIHSGYKPGDAQAQLLPEILKLLTEQP